uniref:AMP-binding domain-containing protein n=1 Tax=Anisakis simplex TaxID=6269 RepID=A0A0M3KH07_ANISI
LSVCRTEWIDCSWNDVYYSKQKYSLQAGEICYRGAHVFKGYFKNDEGTREVLDADGWLHSGDIGRWTERGTLKIVDRKKHIFKLQQGEYIAPEKIEAVYDRSEYVVQSFVYGESLKTCLVAIIVPDQEVPFICNHLITAFVLPRATIVLRDAKQKLDLAETDFKKLCRNDVVKKMILNDLIIVGRKAGLNSFEQVKDIYLSVERFTIANDLLTPTMKNKRPQIKSHFMKELNEMYSKLK